MERRIKLKQLNAYITCRLCKGYLIDATTVTECLHTFCKSCLVKYLEDNNTCPQCETVIHQSYPLQYISYDRTMQDIVYKLVPNLQLNELKREKEFYRLQGKPFPRTLPPNLQALLDGDAKANENNGSASLGGGESAVNASNTTTNNGDVQGDCHRTDEQVNILLETESDKQLKQMQRKFIRVSSQATVTHLKKFISKRLFNSVDRYRDVEILCNQEILGKDHTLKFVFVTRWRFKDPPLRLSYRPKMEL